MPNTQAEPRLSSFGLADDVQMHTVDDRGEGMPQPNSTKRRVAVSRRGSSNKRGAAVDMDNDQESNEGDHGDAADDLDASANGEESDFDSEADTQDGDDDVNAGDDGGDEDEGENPDPRPQDAKTRKQWQAANGKMSKQLADQAKEIARLQGRADGQDARNAQANAAQNQRQAAEGDADDQIDEMFDKITGGDADSEEFVTAAQVKTKDKQRKDLRKLVEGQVTGALKDRSDAEIRALWAIPGASAAYNDAKASGLVDRIAKDHEHVAPLMYAIVTESHVAEIKTLTDKHKTEVGEMKEQLRRLRNGDIPAGNGSRGSAGTGGGGGRGLAGQHPLIAAMDSIKKKQGNTSAR